jgi:LysM repeat protein
MEERNQRPEDASKLPIITLAVLVFFILALLYTGYQYFSDGPEVAKKEIKPAPSNNTEELKVSEPTKELEKPAQSPKTIAETKKPDVKEIEKPVKKLIAEIPDGGIIIPLLVQQGETFFGIANRFNLKADVLRALNPDIDPQSIKVGVTQLKVKIRAKHTVGPGDILSVVAKKYDITKKALMDANKLDKDFSKRGDVLLIPLK